MNNYFDLQLIECFDFDLEKLKWNLKLYLKATKN